MLFWYFYSNICQIILEITNWFPIQYNSSAEYISRKGKTALLILKYTLIWGLAIARCLMTRGCDGCGVYWLLIWYRHVASNYLFIYSANTKTYSAIPIHCGLSRLENSIALAPIIHNIHPPNKGNIYIIYVYPPLRQSGSWAYGLMMQRIYSRRWNAVEFLNIR